jgi:hypothetical protein
MRFNIGALLKGGAILSVILLGTTFAANITIGNSGSQEFGQGIQVTSACDPSFTVKPISTFNNGVSAGYKVSGFAISNLDSTARNSSSGLGCANVAFKLDVYGETGSALASYSFNNYGTSFTSTDGTIIAQNAGTTSSSLTLTLSNATVSADQVYRVTVQSSETGPRTFVLGDTGPGGGTVFYVNLSGFACGATLSDTCKYIEYAPALWASGFPEWTTPTANGGWSDHYALNNGAVDPPIPMVTNCTRVIPGSTAIGASLQNTIAIATCAPENAAEHVRAYRGGGFSDWAIPTRLELSAMNTYRKSLYPNWQSVNDSFNGGISSIDAFWSSSGSGNGFSFEYLNRDTRGPLGPTTVTFQLLIKPVRAF